MKIEKEELLTIFGGVSLTSSLISSVYRAASTVFEIGKALGSSIRRMINGSLCPI